MSLQAADQEAAAHAVAPRVTLADMEAAIAARIDTTGDKLGPLTVFHPFPAHEERAASPGPEQQITAAIRQPLALLSICILVMRNGFTVIGKSAPASPENFNAEFGKKLAYEDAVRQIWPLMGFALRDRLAAQPTS